MSLPHALIVAGPTCSGKSALALGLAERLGGAVINADSMQLYRELRIVTARPTPEDEARAPHLLYGIRPAAEAGSVAWWRDTALAAMQTTHAAGQLPILCGGTGLYFAALRDGLAEIPPIPDAARAEARARLASEGPAALHAALAAIDSATAATIRPTDAQRIARAYEVWRATGQGLSIWQQQTATPAPWRFTAILLDPPRDALRAAIATRFTAMLAHGVPELAAHLRGTLSLPEAARRAELATGQYTKRQATWFRRRPLADPARTHTIHARIANLQQFSESDCPKIISFIQSAG